MDISNKILSDPVNRWIFETAGASASDIYIVGGYVRDLFRGVKSNDRDFASKDAKKMAGLTAEHFRGTLVVLMEKHAYRVVVKRSVMIDFSSFDSSIHQDLKRRDFTVNAIAWAPRTGIVDPFNGVRGISDKTVSAVLKKNLLADPLRIIRAYRISSDLGFRIDDSTRLYLKRYAKSLRKVSEERITEEFFKLLNNNNCFSYIDQCHEDSVLSTILSANSRAERSVLSANMRSLKKFNIFMGRFSSKKRHLELISKEFSQKLKTVGLLRLYLVCNNLSYQKGLFRFSRDINSALKDIHNALKISTHPSGAFDLYDIFSLSGRNIFETALLYSFINKKNVADNFKRATEFMNIKNTLLLNGFDIQKILGIKPGKRIGEVMSALNRQRFNKSVTTKAEARKWILSNYT